MYATKGADAAGGRDFPLSQRSFFLLLLHQHISGKSEESHGEGSICRNVQPHVPGHATSAPRMFLFLRSRRPNSRVGSYCNVNTSPVWQNNRVHLYMYNRQCPVLLLKPRFMPLFGRKNCMEMQPWWCGRNGWHNSYILVCNAE